MAKFFQKVNMESESVPSKNRTGLYLSGSGNDTPAALPNGAFLTTSTLAANSIYTAYNSGSNIYDFNTFNVTAPAAVTTKPIYVADFVKVMDGTIGGNVYRMGAKTLSGSANASEKVRIRKCELNDQFILGADNFVSTPTVGQYGILTAGSIVLSGSAGAGSGFAVRVEEKKTITEGVTSQSTGYLCTVVQL